MLPPFGEPARPLPLRSAGLCRRPAEPRRRRRRGCHRRRQLRPARRILQLSPFHPGRRQGLRPQSLDHRPGGLNVALHFSREELAGRRAAACTALAKRGLDGLLIFRQESMYYLTGYDTFGYVYFQCLYLGADGTLTLLTRAPDLLQAKHTSVVEDIRIWVDAPDAKPAEQLREILASLGCKGKRLGVEWESYGLTARNGQRLTAALEGFCTLADASE